MKAIASVPKRGIDELQARSFEGKWNGKIFQGFVVRKDNQFHAYRNLCRHLPVTLDLGDEDFFNHEKEFLQCHMHGALYEIHTGLCVAGPCEGARLEKLIVVEEGNRLVIMVPEGNT